MASPHLLSGERQNWEEVHEKAHLKDSLPSGAPFPYLFGSLMCWGGHNCPCPSLLCMCMCTCTGMCTTRLGKGKSLGISLCSLGKPGQGKAGLPATTPPGNPLGSPLFCFWCLVGFGLSDHFMWIVLLPLMDSFRSRRKDMSLLFSQGLSPSVIEVGKEAFSFSLRIVEIC